MLLWSRGSLRITGEFVETDGDGLAEVHGAVLFAGGDAYEPMAVAEVFIREPALLRAEEQGDTVSSEMLAEVMRGLIEAAHRVLQLTKAYGCGPYNESAIFDGFSKRLKLLGFGKQGRSADRGARLAKSEFVGVHDTKVEEAKVAHRAGGGTDVERIARGNEHDSQAIGFGIG